MSQRTITRFERHRRFNMDVMSRLGKLLSTCTATVSLQGQQAQAQAEQPDLPSVGVSHTAMPSSRPTTCEASLSSSGSPTTQR